MTRYPKSGRGRRWTVVELKAVSRDWRGDSLADGDGLVGTVRVGDGRYALANRFPALNLRVATQPAT